MKDVIILEKVREKKKLSKSIIDTTAQAKLAWTLSLVDLARRYKWAMSNVNLDVTKELGLTGIQKYQRCVDQVKMELDWLHDWIFAQTTFVKHSRRVYDNDKVTELMKVRQDIDPKWVLFFFVPQFWSIQY